LDASINLKDILNSYHDGQMLLKTYESSNKLNGLLRNKLTHIMITHFLKSNKEKKIPTEKLSALSQEICFLFPQENKDIYYIPYKKEGNIGSPARGKLWDKYNNLRKEIRKRNQNSTKEITTENAFVPSAGNLCNLFKI